MKKVVKLTESDIKRIVKKTIIEESHAISDNEKKEYIVSALDNLSLNDLDEIYLRVEELDPEYEGYTKYKQEYVPSELGGYHKDIRYYDKPRRSFDSGPR